MRIRMIVLCTIIAVALCFASTVMAQNLTYRDILDEATFVDSLGSGGYANPWYSAVNDNSMKGGDSTWRGSYCFYPAMYMDGIDWGGMTQWSWDSVKSITEVSFYRGEGDWGWPAPTKVMIDYQLPDGTWVRVPGGATDNWIEITWTNTDKWGNPTDREFTVQVNAPEAVGIKLFIGRYGGWAAVEEVDVMGMDAVPEPGSILALGGGLVGMAGFVIRRRKRL